VPSNLKLSKPSPQAKMSQLWIARDMALVSI
jgi:hypothetical protein